MGHPDRDPHGELAMAQLLNKQTRGNMMSGFGSLETESSRAKSQRSMELDMFRLEKLLGVHLKAKPGMSSLPNVFGFISELLGDTVPSGQGGMASTAGGHTDDHEFVAAACSGAVTGILQGSEFTSGGPHVLIAAASSSLQEHHLLLCAVEKGHKPVLRALPWYDGPKARITALAFNSTGEFLLTGTAGGAVHIVPAAALLSSPRQPIQGGAEGGGPEKWSSSGDPKGGQAARALCSFGPVVISVVWWQRSLDKQDIAIAVARSGEVRFWNCTTGQPLCACVVGGRLEAATLVPGLACQFLLLSGESLEWTQGGGTAFWSVMLEREHEAEAGPGVLPLVEALPEAVGRPGFSPAMLRGRFGVPGLGAPQEEAQVSDSGNSLAVLLSVHRTAGDGVVVARHDLSTDTLELYDPLSGRHPLFVHRLPKNTVAFELTHKLLYALHGSHRAGYRLSVLARSSGQERRAGNMRKPGRRSTDKSVTEPTEPLVLQELIIPAEVGIPGGLLPMATLWSQTTKGGSKKGPTQSPLEGVLLWTAGAVYHCHTTVAPEAVFYQLLGAPFENPVGGTSHLKGKLSNPREGVSTMVIQHDDKEGDRRAELFGTALGLDVLGLYSSMARECVRSSEFRRALRLFQLAGARPEEVIQACLAEGCPDAAMHELGEVCAMGKGLRTRKDSRQMALLRLSCLVHVQLTAWSAAAASTALSAAPKEAAANAAAAAAAAAKDGSPFSPAAAAAAVANFAIRPVQPPTNSTISRVGDAPAQADSPLAQEPANENTLLMATAAKAAMGTAAAADTVSALCHTGGALHAHHVSALDEAKSSSIETDLRLLLSCGRIAEALPACVASSESGAEDTARAAPASDNTWLSPAQKKELASVLPTAEEAVSKSSVGGGTQWEQQMSNGRTREESAAAAAYKARSGSLVGRESQAVAAAAGTAPLSTPGRARDRVDSSSGWVRGGLPPTLLALVEGKTLQEKAQSAALKSAHATSISTARAAVEEHIKVLLRLVHQLQVDGQEAARVQAQTALEAVLRGDAVGSGSGARPSSATPAKAGVIYSAAWALGTCSQWRNYDAMAVLYSLHAEWQQAVECRLKSLAQKFPAEAPDEVAVRDLQLALVGLLETHCLRPRCPRQQARALLPIVRFWLSRGLCQEYLEKLLTEQLVNEGHAKAVALVLGALQRPLPGGRHTQGPPGSPKPAAVPPAAESENGTGRAQAEAEAEAEAEAVVETELEAQASSGFTPEMHLKTYAAWAAEAARAHSMQHPMAPHTLWTQVKRNLHTGLAQPRMVRVTQPPEGAESADATLAFTCGHSIPRTILDRKMIPQLIQHLERGSVALPVVSSLLLAEYKTSAPSIACPACVLQSIDQELGSSSPESGLALPVAITDQNNVDKFFQFERMFPNGLGASKLLDHSAKLAKEAEAIREENPWEGFSPEDAAMLAEIWDKAERRRSARLAQQAAGT
ncbi:hypothetical protein CYMTET_50728 [Cymbomonas tetramitiformis]|uniref:Uncharacterized protein n=1 Tax=Cymbomonas tetramitiformis TaxID=36881 RepID=A0AAE0ET70_9CHLO|nr:hypothetical protein CYMTET_50728 [Cymbomonas tetramitiformis]